MSQNKSYTWLPVYTRQGLSLVAVVLLLAIGFVALLVWSNERYHQEVTQQLHKGLAQYVAEHTKRPVFDAQGEVDQGVLKAIAMNTMMINPSVEVYLLDPEGKVLGHALPDIDESLTDINIKPIQQFLASTDTGPVFGTNPRHPEQQGIFSVAALGTAEDMHGYLYVMLASKARSTLAKSLEDSYILKVALAGVLMLTLVFVACLMLGFRHFSQPIRALAAKMRAYRRSIHDAPLNEIPSNEVDELNEAFEFLQQRVQEQFEQLAQNDAQRRELVSNISHDLRTPLAAMQGYLETLMLKKEQLSDEQREQFVSIAHRHGEKLNTLIAQLFELSKLDTGRMAAQFERFSITELLSDVCAEYQILAEKHELKIVLDVPVQSLEVKADIALIGRVIQNLVDNAIAHTEPGGEIVLGLERQGALVSVSVRDSGRGISKESLPFVFERHYQAEAPQARKATGAGLGLSIVKKILDLHDAAINVQSELARGTLIRFELAVSSA